MDISVNKKLAIIKTGGTYNFIKNSLGDFDKMIINKLSLPEESIKIYSIYEDEFLPKFDEICGVIITGSHSMVTDLEPWSIRLESWLRKISEFNIPVLGICYGHQVIARAFGGDVNYHADGHEIGSAKIFMTQAGEQDPLMGILPSQFDAYVAHSQSVIKLPKGATLLAGNNFEKTQAFVIKNSIWGVQFHPEFTSYIINAYIDTSSAKLIKEGFNIEALKAAVIEKENDFGTKLLRRFVELIETQYV